MRKHKGPTGKITNRGSTLIIDRQVCLLFSEDIDVPVKHKEPT